MSLLTGIAVFLVAILHVWFMVLEMFLWTKPAGLRTFRMSPEHALATRTLAANQGLYNGFIACGLFLGVFLRDASIAHAFQIYFLGCVVVAGAYGAVTVSRRIFYIQSLPAIVALVLSLSFA